MNYEQDSLTQWHFRHDALDAFNSFSAARNLFFLITIAGLLIIQLVFWAVDQGAIDNALEIPQKENIQINDTMPGGSVNTQSHPKGFVLCSFKPAYSFCQDLGVPEKEQKTTQEKEASTVISKENESTIKNILLKTIQIARVIVIFSIIMYCICLFLCIQLTLTGSLGGMSYSVNAFFFALVATLFVLPWQKSVMSGIPTVLYNFNDIIKAYSAKTETSSFSYYSRFMVMWIAVILLLISQWRSSQAIKQISARAKEWKSINPLAQLHPVHQPAPSQQIPVVPQAAQTGAPVPVQPIQPGTQNPNDTGYDNGPIPLE